MADRLVLALPGDTRPGVVWHAPLLNYSGYADEARNFVLGLRGRGADLRAEALGDPSASFVRGLSPDAKAALDAATRSPLPRHAISVLHVPGEAAQRVPGSAYHVARSMFETDGLPAAWVPRLNEMDEIWVPTQFNVDTFRAAGVTVPLHIVPGGVTPGLFVGAEPLPIDGLSGTVFLSVFEWSFRKGWDVLLKAWAKAFTADDDVTLLLRTYPMQRTSQRIPQADIERQINTYLGKLGTSRKRVAPIVVLHEHVADADMPRLYATAHAYVSPTRGEGWGRPLLEAMATGLPVLATRWSGNLEFMHDDNSLLIDVEALDVIDEREELDFYRGQRWARPSATHLAQLLSDVASDHTAAAAIGARAQAEVAQRWTWSAAVDAVEARLAEIEATLRRATAKPGGVPVRWVGEQYSWHSLAQVNRELCQRLVDRDGVELELVSHEHATKRAISGDPVAALEAQTGDVLSRAPRVEVRHQWPPDWSAPRQGAWVVMQPWEFGGLPDAWVPPLVNDVDEVWCYTDFVRDCYVASGVPEAKLRVIPLGVDTARFSPDGEALRLRTRKTHRLLFVGGTIARKGIDVLLDAYTATFTPDDDVCLVIKAFGAQGVYRDNSDDERIRALAADPTMPEIELLTDDLSPDEMAGLYRACTALVHPYRGEGFGMPIAEAMACGLPVAVTNHGAALDFCDAQSAFLIPATVVPVPEGGLTPNTTGYWWAEPDPVALRGILRALVDDPAAARAIGERGRARVTDGLSWDAAATAIEQRLKELATVVPVRFTEAQPATGLAATANVGVQRNQFALKGTKNGLVSACMIVRDEADNLPGCLAALDGMVDEVVIYDTGSVDDTVAWARAAGAHVIEGTWDDDFARARNEALAACTGTWILWVDADDRLRGNAANFRKVLKKNPPVDTIAITIDNLDATGAAIGFSDQNVRVFRRDKGRWVGRLHETIAPRPGRNALRTGHTTDIWFLHSGYSDASVDIKAKSERNVRICEAELAEGTSRRSEVLIHLGRSLSSAGRLDEAVTRFEEALAATSVPAQRRFALRHGAEALIEAGRAGEAREWIDRLRAASKRTDMADWLEGIACAAVGDADGALAKLAYLSRVRDDDGLVIPDHVVRLRRARLACDAERWSEAADDLLAIVTPDVAPPWAMLVEAHWRAGRDASEVAAAIPPTQLVLALGQLLSVPSDAADAVAEALFSRQPDDATMLAFVSELAPRLGVERALEWSARLRQAGLAERCPLLAIAQSEGRAVPDRVLAACLLLGAFGDERAHDALRVVARFVDADALVDTLLLIDQIEPQLLPEFITAAAFDRDHAVAVSEALRSLGAVEQAEVLLEMAV